MLFILFHWEIRGSLVRDSHLHNTNTTTPPPFLAVWETCNGIQRGALPSEVLCRAGEVRKTFQRRLQRSMWYVSGGRYGQRATDFEDEIIVDPGPLSESKIALWSDCPSLVPRILLLVIVSLSWGSETVPSVATRLGIKMSHCQAAFPLKYTSLKTCPQLC